MKMVTGNVSVPVVASGGMGSYEDMVKVVKEGMADGVAMADILHYDKMKLDKIREMARKENFHVRSV